MKTNRINCKQTADWNVNKELMRLRIQVTKGK